MKIDEIRERYLDFFVEKGHKLCASDVLVPTWDKSVLFTPAGMNPFKDHFLGKVELEFTRATSCQKCLRTGDIENVGRTAYHHTYFEMLGNFSFGDYFKRETIHWAWEFLTSEKGLAIDADKLTVTVYLDDDEAAEIWQNDIGLDAKRIERLDEYENFWPAGAPSSGPDGTCGPCSEIFYHPHGIGNGNDVEIWNLVFTEFNRSGDPPNNLTPLPHQNIDTGMGLERIAATLQGVQTNFHIDSLRPVVDAAAEITGFKYVADSDVGRFLRRITDHIRACTMAIHENVYPGSSKAEYVVRRLIRRCTLEGRRLGHQEPFLYKLVPAIVESVAKPYPEIGDSSQRIQQVIKAEEASFLNKLDDGLVRIEKIFAAMESSGRELVDGNEAADLYQTFGIPPELIESQAQNRSFQFDWSGFKTAMEAFGLRSGKIAETVMGDFGPIDEIKKEAKSTEFLGYQSLEADAKVVGLVKDEQRTDKLVSGDGAVVLQRTPFYAESGGQVGDTGKLVGPNGSFAVTDVKKNGDLFIHYGQITEGSILTGQTLKAQVDIGRRESICRAHTATHILHYSLQQTLGSHAQQRGSKVDSDWLRFDFANLEPVSADDLDTIEQLTIQQINSAASVAAQTLPLTAAKEQGAMMLFGEKYPDPVRMVSIGDFSKELCGGTHLQNSSDVGLFEIAVEESVSSGTRRIEALTGDRASAARDSVKSTIGSVAQLFAVGESKVLEAFDNLIADVKELKKRIHSGNQHEIPDRRVAGGSELEYLDQRAAVRKMARVLNIAIGDVLERVTEMVAERKQLFEKHRALRDVESIDADSLIEMAEQLGDVRVIAAELASSNPNLMRQLIDQIRKKSSPAAVFLATAVAKDKVVLVAGVSKDLVEAGIKAGDWVKEIAPIVGGGGGGKPDLAQAGGKDPSKIGDALTAAKQFISGKVDVEQ